MTERIVRMTTDRWHHRRCHPVAAEDHGQWCYGGESSSHLTILSTRHVSITERRILESIS
jgi:hypothetical protein